MSLDVANFLIFPGVPFTTNADNTAKVTRMALMPVIPVFELQWGVNRLVPDHATWSGVDAKYPLTSAEQRDSNNYTSLKIMENKLSG